MSDLAERLADVLAPGQILTGDAITDDYTHDEALTVAAERPACVVRPGSTAEVAAVLRLADELGIPVTARGSGTGLSGACVPRADGIVVSFERMNRILEIDTENHVAVVAARRHARPARRGDRARTASSIRCSPASTARASAATSPRTRAGCAR